MKYIINKVDICNLFLFKCCFRKCIEKPLEALEPFCKTNQSQNAVYVLLIIILRNLEGNDLYVKILEFLGKYHKSGFWKTYNVKNWDLESKEMQKGKYVGLKNMNSTCYLNSIIQQLYMIEIFRETILKINNSSKSNVLYELQLLFSALKIYEFSYYDPKSFVVANKLNFDEQMDADEFYGSLIDKIENEIKSLYQKTPSPSNRGNKEPKDSKNDNYKYKDIFNYFFGIKVLDELKFVDCGHKRYNEFFYNSIQLEIKEFNNIYDSLKNYFKTEIMDGDNKINCEQCKIKRTCHKHLIFKSLPNILVIALKRFEFDYNTMLKYKLNKYFEFPFKLDMKEYLKEGHKEKNTEYELTGITIHYGVSDFGHYYDLIKGPDNKWYKFNDISVSEFKEENIPKEAFGEKELGEEDSSKENENKKNNAYILIYKKKDFEKEIINKKNIYDLALPPYNKYSNINEELKKEINCKLYKTWTVKNIFSHGYQKFILNLIKIDLVKIIDSNVEKSYPEIIRCLKKDEYFVENNKNTIYKTPDGNNDQIFEFYLRYYFGVILRTIRRAQINFNLCREIVKIYVENNIQWSKYILEEFSNDDALDEYLLFCPIKESSKDCLEIIVVAFNNIYKKSASNNNVYDSFIFEYIDTLIIYITDRIREFDLEYINDLLMYIMKKGGNKYISYLKKKNIHKWVNSFYGNGIKENLKDIVNPNTYPVIHSQHCILIDKNIDNKKKKLLNEESDLYTHHFINKLKDNTNNRKLIEFFGQFFRD